MVRPGLAAALLAPKLKGGGAAEAATSGLEAVEVAPKLKAGGAAAADDVAAVVEGVGALAAAPPKLKVEVEEAAGAPDSEVWAVVLPPDPKLKAPVVIAVIR